MVMENRTFQHFQLNFMVESTANKKNTSKKTDPITGGLLFFCWYDVCRQIYNDIPTNKIPLEGHPSLKQMYPLAILMMILLWNAEVSS